MYDVTTLGEVLIDFTPEKKHDEGPLLFEPNPGGAPANVVAALAKMGRKTSFIGKVGKDQFGEYLKGILQDCGIETKGIVFSEETKTTLAFVHLNDQGDRSFSFFRNPGADMMLKDEEVDLELIKRSKVFHFGSLSMTHEPALSATMKAVNYAKNNGLLISFDPNLRIPLWKDLKQAKSMMEFGLRYADILKISEEELEFITGIKDLETGSQYIYERYQTKLILVTLGADGCFYRLGNQTGERGSYKVNAIDTTGAGDAFLAGILYQITERQKQVTDLSIGDVEEMVGFANAVGALTTTKKGAIPALPSIEEILSLMKKITHRDQGEEDQMKMSYYQEKYRPQFHFTPETNWMNDPNGLVYYEDEYHLFYQFHPHGNTWGPMHWGHAVSKDLVSWDHFPIALFPDHNGYIFSGSAVVDWNDSSGFFNGGSGIVAIFTHADSYPHSDRPRQRQSLAYSSDRGRSWTMYEGNPVITEEGITDFRDPKVFWHETSRKWIMVLAAGNCVRIYFSSNLKEWSFASEFGADAGSHDGVWECPDLFELPVDEDPNKIKWVMIVSIGNAEAYAEGSRTQYFIGQFDGIKFLNENDPANVLWLDHGRDNYAGVTWSDIPKEDGRRVYIGWMSNWKYANQTPTEVWRSVMTIPRVLALRSMPEGIRLVQTPVSELETLRQEKLEWSDLPVTPGNNILSDIFGDKLEIVAEFELDTAAEFGFKVRKSEGQETVIGYETFGQTLFIDRTQSGVVDFCEHFPSRHAAALRPKHNRIKLHIFVDWSSVEVFGNDGILAMTDLIFPDPASIRLEVYAKEGNVKLVSLKMFMLQPIYTYGQTLNVHVLEQFTDRELS